jgi:hypothetical protein
VAAHVLLSLEKHNRFGALQENPSLLHRVTTVLYQEDTMIQFLSRTALSVLVLAVLLGAPLRAGNDIMGEIQFVGASKVEKTSGVWVDGQYVGYLKELKGSKKVVLLPGQHEIIVRQGGYHDFTQKVILEPGQKHVIQVAMQKNPAAQFPDATAQVKMSVSPNRAAVFVDDQFVGHVDEFDGPGQALLVAPGKRRVKITLPGYRTFETELNLLAEQKFELKTELFKGSILQAGPLMNEKDSDVARAK